MFGVKGAYSCILELKLFPTASSFDHVHEFNIFGSLFDRASMWGFKLEKCGEFNILGGSRFYRSA